MSDIDKLLGIIESRTATTVYKRMRFIGKDKYLGLRKGQIYDVVIWEKRPYIFVGWDYAKILTIPKCCPYSSYVKLLENWEVVR